MKFIRILIWLSLGFLVMFILYRWYDCNRKGKEAGRAYRCPLFCKDPKFYEVQEVFHQMLEGKCYEVTDYGKAMSYRQVTLEECGERPPVLRQESLADFEIVNEQE